MSSLTQELSYLTSARLPPNAQVLALFLSLHGKHPPMRDTLQNECNFIIFTAVFDQFVNHTCVLHHLTIDGNHLVAHVEGGVEERSLLLDPAGHPENDKTWSKTSLIKTFSNTDQLETSNMLLLKLAKLAWNYPDHTMTW